MEESTSFDWSRYRLSVQQALLSLPHFLTNPIEGMRQLPDWDWPILFTVEGLFGMSSGFFRDMLGRHVISAIVSIFVAPFVANVVVGVLSGFFFYTFMFFFRRHLDFRRIFTHLVFASIPVLLMAILTPLVPLIGLVGLGAASLLLIVGFTSNFDLPLKQVRNLIFGLFLAYSALLIVQMITWRGGKEKLRVRATPESLDILEKELKTNSN